MSDITITYTNNISSNANKFVGAEKSAVNDNDTKKAVNEQVQSVKEQDQKVSLSAKKREDNEKLQESTVKAKEQEKEVSRAVQERNEKLAKERMDALNKQNIGLNFSVDTEKHNTIVKVTDMNTKKLVRQIPSEEFLKMTERLENLKAMSSKNSDDKSSFVKGMLFDENA